jgi:hypothetical protein
MRLHWLLISLVKVVTTVSMAPFRITKGKRFQLNDFDPGDTRGLRLDKGEAADLLQRGTEWLAEEQDMLYADPIW